MRVSPEFFATLGVNLALGRSFTEAETALAEDHGVAILTDAYWRQRFVPIQTSSAGNPGERVPGRSSAFCLLAFGSSLRKHGFSPDPDSARGQRAEAAPFRRRRDAHDRAA